MTWTRIASSWSLGRSLTLLITLSTASAQLASTGFSVTLNNVYYFISPFSSGKVDFPKESLSTVPAVIGLKPVTVIRDSVSQTDVSELLANWTTVDDVYQPAFSEAIFLVAPGVTKGSRSPEVTNIQILPGVSSSVIRFESPKIPSGPYFLEVATGSLYPVYRLYEDFAGAFVEPLIPTPDGKFQTMSAKIPGAASLTVGVPSRLYFTKTADKPLAGVRVGIKDIYQLAGVKTSNGNRAWYHLYPPSNVTGTAVQRLIDAGAQIVGLQKTSQFANGEIATADWVDYHSPFNPRGDGYSDPGSSSSGAAASVATYDWLDLALGSDTGGSIRGPAGTQGLFGNRPSHGLVSLDHVMPLAPDLDTAGFLVRDPDIWDAANAVLYKANYTSLTSKRPHYPNRIYTLAFPSAPTVPSDKLLVDFASAVARFVNGTVQSLDLDSEWASTRPAEAGNATINQLFNATYTTIITKEQTRLLRDPFYRDYAAAYEGRRPFVNPTPLVRWAYGDSLPDGALLAAIAEKALFQDWFNKHVLPPSPTENQDFLREEGECSSSLILYPAATEFDAIPRYWYKPPPSVPFGFYEGRISVLAGVPDSVFPLGEVVGIGPDGESAGVSDVTGKEEAVPVAVSVLAARGCDGLLARLARDLVAAGVLRVPRVGKSAVEGGEVLMRRAWGGEKGWGQ
ncbi:amidase signature domain-containing protein [Corynascus similis CBS 632.67]